MVKIVAASRERTHQQSAASPHVIFDSRNRAIRVVTCRIATMGFVLLEKVAAIDIVVLDLHLEIVMNVGQELDIGFASSEDRVESVVWLYLANMTMLPEVSG